MMTNKVSSKQITHAAAIVIIATSLVTKPLYTFAKNDAWIAAIAGILIAALIYLIYAALARKFPDVSLIEINDRVFGGGIGKIVSILYIFYFFSMTCFDTNIMTNFVKAFVLPNTPMVLILFLFLLVCLYASKKGPSNMMKYSTIFLYVGIAILLMNGFLLYKNYDFRNLQPILSQPINNYVLGIHSITVLPLCDPFALIMFLPAMYRPKEFGKAMTKGLFIGGAVLLFIVLRDITVLGGATAENAFPSYSTIRLIDVGDVFTRMDIIYISLLISLMFYKVVVLFYASVTGVQRLMKFDSYQFLVYIFGGLLLIYSLTVFRSSSEHMEWLLSGAAEYYQTFFIVLIPFVTLIVAMCRGFFGNVTPAIKNEA